MIGHFSATDISRSESDLRGMDRVYDEARAAHIDLMRGIIGPGMRIWLGTVDCANAVNAPLWARRAIAAEKEIERLKTLIKDAEFSNWHQAVDSGFCPWCDSDRRQGHSLESRTCAGTCPAFTPDGKVR